MWRDLVALVACVLTVVSVVGGLMTFLWWAQFALIAGLVVGLIASSPIRAALVAAAGTAIGLILGPVASAFYVPTAASRIQFGFVSTLLAMLFGAGIAHLVRRAPGSARILVWIAVTVVVANLWATTLAMNAQPVFDRTTGAVVPSMNDQLEGTIPAGLRHNDDVLYLRVYQSVRAGEPYYRSYGERFAQWGKGEAPSSVLNVRSPLLTYFWAGLPGPRWIVYAFLALATAAVLLVRVILSGIVKAPLAIPASAALASHFLYFPRQLPLFTTEVWAVMLALVSFAAGAASFRSRRWRLLVLTAAALAGLAFAVRETLVFVPIAGLAASFVAGPQRRFRLAAWASALGVGGLALGVHYWLARSIVDPASPYRAFKWGGLSRAIGALAFATDNLGGPGWLAFGLAGLGLLGALLIPDVGLRVFASVSTFAPLVAFLVVSNTAIDTRTGLPLNYWGAAVVPLIYACVPLAFALLPGVASGARREPVVEADFAA